MNAIVERRQIETILGLFLVQEDDFKVREIFYNIGLRDVVSRGVDGKLVLRKMSKKSRALYNHSTFASGILYVHAA